MLGIKSSDRGRISTVYPAPNAPQQTAVMNTYHSHAAVHHVRPARVQQQRGRPRPRSDFDVGADEGAGGGLGQVHLRRREQGRHGRGKLHSAGESDQLRLLCLSVSAVRRNNSPRLISLDRVLLIYMSRALVQEWRDPANEWYDGYGSRRGIIYQSIEGMSSVYILAATPKLLMPCLF